MKIEDLGLSARAYNVLKRVHIDTVEQLQQLSDDDLLRYRNMGTTTVKEIREKVAYVKTMTRADLIRKKNDDELAAWIHTLLQDGDSGFFCQQKPKCQIAIDTIEGIPDSWCLNCLKEWLQTPAEEPKLSSFFEDKQESGLLED